MCSSGPSGIGWICENRNKNSLTRSGDFTDCILRPTSFVNIRLLNGITHKFGLHKSWTVAQLKENFAKFLERSDSLFTMFHKTRRLQDGDTLESYSIPDGKRNIILYFINCKEILNIC